jgi:hypothetical protein
VQDESPEVVIPVVPPVCDHSNKEAQTPVSDHPGRFHCEDCSTCYGEPLPTEAAIARDKKALKKHKFPKSTPGADSIALGGDIAKTAKIVDTAAEEAARDNDLAVRAVPVLAALRDYVTVCKAEEAAVNLRETFLEKLKDRDALFLIAQELGDFFSVRRGRKFTLPNGNTYTSVKVLIKDEVGCSYEYFLSLGKKLGKFQRVLPSDARPALQPKPQTSLPPQAPTQTPINIPAETEEPPQEEPQLSHSSSVSERVQFALAAVTKCAKFLSPSETDEFYGSLIAKLQSEMQFDVEVADEVEEEVEA